MDLGIPIDRYWSKLGVLFCLKKGPLSVIREIVVGSGGREGRRILFRLRRDFFCTGSDA